jgi:hypothetical protein
MLERQLNRLRTELGQLDKALGEHPAADLEAVGRKVGRWLGKYPAAAAVLTVETKKDDQGRACGLELKERTERMPWAQLAHGAYLLRTNHPSDDPEAFWRWYIQLSQAEAAFRTGKSDLHLRPVFHQKTQRVEAHISVSFLSLALWRTLEQWMRAKGLGDCARQLLLELDELRSMDVILPTRAAGEIRLRLVARPEKALAQCASSPLFKKTYPATAALYLQKAQLGWNFLTNAIAKYGKNGAYQKITAYGDDFADNDEMAWAACQMFLATGDTNAHKMLLSWFNPSNPATWRWGWWHMSESYGNCIRSYAFAVQSRRVASTNQLNATFLAECTNEIASAGNDMLTWSQQNAYGTSFPSATKAVESAGWYFSADQAFDMAVAYQLNPNTNYLTALLANMNYEGGCNPVNVCYVTGLGWKRQHGIVSQWELNDIRGLAPSGIPIGNIQSDFDYLWDYAGELEELSFPSDGAATAPYPFYDRWGDSWNVTTEMVVLNQARGLGSLAFLAAQTSLATQPWQAVSAQITVPAGVTPVGSNVTVSMQAQGLDLTTARITWEANGQQPAFGQTFTFAPGNNGPQWVEGEAQFSDGRRVFASNNFAANSPNIVWVQDSIPTGGVPGADGGDSWNWVSNNPTPYSGFLAQQSALESGEHQIYFDDATATLSVETNAVLYAWIYLDPSNMPSEAMLQWNDQNGSWEHRAYWGANQITFGVDGAASRTNMGALPAAGQWAQLAVPASLVNLAGSTLNGLAFTLYGGRATWDCAGVLNSMTAGTNSSLSVGAPGTAMISLAGNTVSPATVQMSGGSPTLTWVSGSNTTYRVFYKNNLTDPAWLVAGPDITATGVTTTWTDTNNEDTTQRFYVLMQVQ